MIPEETVIKITESANIVEIISEFLTLTKRGINYIGNCPFHNEKTPSFTVSPTKNIYKCFGCGKSGNVVNFIMEHENMSYPEALYFLANKLHIQIEQVKLSPEEKKRNELRERLKAINNYALEHFRKDLVNPAAEKYIKEREISPEMVEKFKIGFAVNSWNGLYGCAKAENYPDEILINASLAGKSDKGIFDYFRNRLIFPFLDMYGNSIGFTGRIVGKPGKEPKYLNSKDTDLFKKGRVLFGLFQAKKAIMEANKCFLVEGNIDVITLHQLKIENTVCGSGTALTKEQIRLIKKFTSNVTVIYDGDAAGIKASFKNIDLMLGENVNVRAVALPDGEDPDSFAKNKTRQEVTIFIHNNEKDFISFKYEFLKKETKKDLLKEAHVINDILESVVIIPDPVTRDLYKNICTEKFKIDEKTVNQALKKYPVKANESIAGWIGLDWAKEAIQEEEEVYVTGDMKKIQEEWKSGRQNIISWNGEIKHSHLQELGSITNTIILLDPMKALYNGDFKETALVAFCKDIHGYGFNLKVMIDPEKDEEVIYKSFLDHFFCLASEHLNTNEIAFDQERKNRLIEDAAALLSKSDNTTIHTNTKTFALKLGLKETEFKNVMKPYLEKKKSRITIKNEDSEGETLHLDPDRLPDYVDRNFFQKWGYFPYQNKDGKKVRYVFRTMEGGLQIIGNFFIEPLFHVYDQDPEKNKRIIKINGADRNVSYYIEMKSGIMADFSLFKKAMFNEDGFVFTKGKSNHYEAILASIGNQFPRCFELHTFGRQPEGFWAFANAIFDYEKITYTDELGLVQFKENTYYSPAYSKIFAGQRQDSDKYKNDRYFIYRETAKTSFKEWAELMDLVYCMNNNGRWAILFTLLSAFRSIIYPIDRLFTTLFFVGPTESGKSQIAMSIRGIFMHPDAPIFNLTSGTDAAFFSALERNRDVPCIFEEYNDYQITDVKFQGLKDAIYAGEGKQKRKDATTSDLNISKINGVPMLLGQEGPERDDGSLGNRCILCHIPKKDDWSDDASSYFQLLKSKEKEGLTNILLDILKQSSLVTKHFKSYQREIFKQIKSDLIKSNNAYQVRIVNTVSLFLAICKLWEEKAPQLKLPFTYKEFYELAKAKIIAQSEAIMTTNKVAVFFDTIELLLNRPYNGLTPGKEFKIDSLRKITTMRNRNETEEIDFLEDTKILYLRINILHPMYTEIRKGESLKMNNLITYLKDHNAYLGVVKSTRFIWTEVHKIADPTDGKVTEIGQQASCNTSAMVFNYKMLEIDLEKFIKPEGQAEIKYENQEQIRMNFAGTPEKVDEENLPF